MGLHGATGKGISKAIAQAGSPRWRPGLRSLMPMERRFVLFIFFLSGASGLVCEVVWMRMITNVLGSSVYAVSTVLAAFMGGLALGGALIGRLADRGRNGLLLYAALEWGVAGLALILPGALDTAEAWSIRTCLHESRSGLRGGRPAAAGPRDVPTGPEDQSRELHGDLDRQRTRGRVGVWRNAHE